MDLAGNISGASGALNVTVDTVAPTAPTITAFTPDTGVVGDGVTSANVITVSGAAEAGSTVKVYDGTTLLGSTTASSTGAWSFSTTTLANGTHGFIATAMDAAGNISSASTTTNVTIQGTPGTPAITSVSPDTGISNDGVTDANVLTVVGAAEAGSTVKVYDGTTLLGTATANGTGAWSFTTAALANGTHSFTVTATNIAGTTSSASNAVNMTVDTVAPTAPTITAFSPDSGTVGDGITSANVVTVTGAAEAGSTVKVYDGTTLLGTATGQWHRRLELHNGRAGQWHSHADRDGDGPGRQRQRRLERAARHGRYRGADRPDHHGLLAGYAASSAMASPAPTSHPLRCCRSRQHGEGLRRHHAAGHGDGQWHRGLELHHGRLANGTHSLSATATDAAGNVSGSSTVLTSAGNGSSSALNDHSRYDCADILRSSRRISPDSGAVGDGITGASILMTVTGAAEAGSTVKVYDGTTLLGSVLASSTGAWSFTTAALANGTHTLTATAMDLAGNVSGASSALNVTVDTVAPNTPTITAFSPDSGTVGDGITSANVVTVTGAAEAGSTVKVYDGTTLLGTATANGTGAWSFTTASWRTGRTA